MALRSVCVDAALADDVIEPLRAPFAGEDLVGHGNLNAKCQCSTSNA